MTDKTLQALIDEQADIVDFLRNQQTGPNAYPGVPAEYSNWREEQRAWAETAVLFNQSFHMVDLLVTGPGAFDMLSYLAPNSFKGFVPNRAKQFAPVTPEGYIIGDVILFYLADETFELVGRAPTIEWVEYWASTGKWDVKVERDERTVARPLDQQSYRRNYRFQLQGPNAMKILERAMGSTPPDLKFFHMAPVTIAGIEVRALRHGMAGQPGYELFGPWKDYDRVRSALLDAGTPLGLLPAGGRTYSSNTLESGWIPSPLPAVYTGEALRPYREWLSANAYEGRTSIGGSFVSDNIEDYYLNPWELGYGIMVKFDHDFIGREALEKMRDAPKRRKVTLALNNEDVMRVQSSMLTKGERAKYMDYPSAVYAMHPYDAVMMNGDIVGLSTWIGYSQNEGRFLTLAMVDEAVAEPGTEVVLLWGEPDGGTRKPTVEPHVQTEIRATVSPAPYSEVARDSYAEGWRTKAEG